MVCEIDARNLLLNYFSSHPEEHKLGIKYTKELRRLIENEIPGVYVGIHKDYLVDAIVRTEAFDWIDNEKGSHIERIITHRDLKNIPKGDWQIPDEILNHYLNIVQKYEWDTRPHTAWHIVYKSLMRCQAEKDKDFLTLDESKLQLLMTSGINSKFSEGTTQKDILQGLVNRKMARKIGDNYHIQDKIYWGL